MDDVVSIELQAIAGVTYPLIDKTFTPDAAAAKVTDGVTPPDNVTFLDVFPYAHHPKNGFEAGVACWAIPVPCHELACW